MFNLPAVPDRPLKVLVADDDALNLRIAARLLKEQGFGGALVNNGARALQLASEQVFDLMLLDICMPQMDGRETLGLLRQSERQGRRRLPVIMVSGFESRSVVDGLLAAGADGFLVKPLAPVALRAEIRRVIGS
jgi:CheY-like chemotaxis protein